MADRTLRTRLEVDGIDPMVLGFEKAAIAADKLADSVERAGKGADRLGRLATSAERVKKSIPDGKKVNGLADGLARLDKVSPSLDRMSGTLLGIGAAATVGLVAVGKAAIDWESQWAGVTKTVDGTAGQLNDLQGELRDMAKSMPATHDQIASVAEAAGQLGVKTKDVAGFTRVMINLGETTNLTADDAATSLAQLMNVMRTAPEDVDRLGATIVDLGNKGASTEKQIVEMAQRIAGAGQTVGLSETDVLAFASALSSAGIEVEAGGTAISMAFTKMDQKVRLGGDALQVLAETSGVSARDFSRAWSQDAAGAMQMFTEGLGDVMRAGGDTTAILKTLGITGARERDAMLRLASSGDLLAQSLETGKTAWEENTALAVEAGKRYATTESQIKISLNQIKDAAIDAGGVILPIVRDMATTFGGLVKSFDDLPQPVKEFGTQAGLFVAAAALVGGGALRAVTRVAELSTSFRTLQTESPKTAKALGVAGKAVGLLGAALIAANVGSMIEDALGGKTQATVEQFNNVVIGISKGAPQATKDLDALFTQTGKFFSADLDTFGGVNGLDAAMKRMFSKGWEQQVNDSIAGVIGPLTGLSSVSAETEKTISQLDKSMQFMAESGAGDAAADSFVKVADAMTRGGATVDQIVQKFPAYADQLRKTAREQYNLELSNQQLYEWMQGKIPPALKEVADRQAEVEQTAKALTTAEGQLTTTQQGLTKSIQETITQFTILKNGALDVESANTSWERGLIDLEKQFGKTTTSLKINRDASNETRLAVLDNRDAISGLVGGLNESITAQFKQTAETGNFEKAQKDASAALKKGRQDLIDSAVAAGANEKEVTKMIDKMLLTPEQLETQVDAPGLKKTREDIKKLKEEIKELKDKYLKITTEFKVSGLGELNEIKLKNGETIFKGGNKTVTRDGGFSHGGYTGAIDPNAIAGVVHGDEQVIKSPSRRKIEAAHPGALDHMNVYGEIPGYQTGGRVRRKINVDSVMKGGMPDVHAPVDFLAEALFEQSRGKAKELGADIKKALEDAVAGSGPGGAYAKIDVNNPRGLTSFRGGTFTNLAAATLAATEKAAGRTFVIFQGGHRPATSYSGTSHQGDAVDARVDRALMREGIRFGLKLWDRTGKGNWVSHMHGIFGPGAGYGAGSALWQWQDYKNGGDGLAGGGYVRGPGGPRDDRVPIWASNGEYMLPEKAAKVIGPDMLERLRRLGGDMGGYAAGGPIAPSAFGKSTAYDISVIVRLLRAIERPTVELGKLTKAVAAAREGLAGTSIGPAQRTYDRANAAYLKARDARDDAKGGNASQLKKARDRVADLDKEYRAATKAADATKGKTAADRNAATVKERLDAARDRRDSISRGNTADLAKLNAKLTTAQKARTAAQDRLTAAEEKNRAAADRLKQSQEDLAAAQQQVADAARSISDQFSSAYGSASTDPRDWVSRMQQGARDITAFGDQLAGLRKRGLSESVIEQIMAMGVAAGSEFAKNAGRKGSVTELNAAAQALQDAADRLGYGAATAGARKAGGGFVWGPGTATSDSVPIMASRGEYVVNAYQTARNYDTLQSINYGTAPRTTRRGYAGGGLVSAGGGAVDLQVLAAALAGMKIMVENPFTGEYVLSRMRVIADGAVNQFMDTSKGSY